MKNGLTEVLGHFFVDVKRISVHIKKGNRWNI